MKYFTHKNTNKSILQMEIQIKALHMRKQIKELHK